LLIEGSPTRALERTADLKTHPGTPTSIVSAPASIVSDYIAPAPARHVGQMLMATSIVAVLPLAASLGLRALGVISSGWLSVAFAIAFSLGASAAGGAYWRKRGASEVLFSELLFWGWIRRWRQERELANATKLLQLVSPSDEEALSVERREHLLRQLAGALEGQDVYLNGHSRRVARHAMMIARGMGLPNHEVARIRAAAAVHDVGKLLTPKTVLNKPGRLTDAEFEVIKRHPVDGAEMVAALGDPELTRIVRHHHERLDGAGYPDGLAGEEIPLGARIIAVADTFDAITSARPYRDAAPHQKAIDIMRKEAGAQLDPEAVRSFLAYYSGNRPTVVWALVTSSIRRVVAWLSGDPAAAATISASKVAVATAATAVIGVAAAATPVPHVHPLRAVPTASIQHVALRASTRAASAQSALHAPVPVRPPAAHASAAVRPRAVRTTTPDAKASHQHRLSRAASHGQGHANAAASRSPKSPASTSAGIPSTAGGSSSRPTSPNPAGHVNHASSTGNAARNGQTPHPTSPGQSGSSQGNGNAGAQNSQGQGNGGAHSNGTGNAQPSAVAPSSGQDGLGSQKTGSAPANGNNNAQSGGSGQGPASFEDSVNSQTNANAQAAAQPGSGTGNGNAGGAPAPPPASAGAGSSANNGNGSDQSHS
jgi:putative nucleotidyltransferase with HDIG domain